MAGPNAGAKPATPKPAAPRPAASRPTAAKPPVSAPNMPPVVRPAPAPYAQAQPIVPAAKPTRPGIHFSAIEFLHLLVGASVLTYAFAVINTEIPDDQPLWDKLAPQLKTVIAAFVAVTTGFVLHELAHKIVAQRYGHWAEFRAGIAGLLLALGMAPFGLLVALPGATWIQGNVTRKESGVISLYGPLVNFVIALIAVGFRLAINPVNPDEPLPYTLGLVAQVNAFLAAFNLLPIPFFGAALDGVKVWRWNRAVWVSSFVVALGTVALIMAWLLHIFP